MLNLKSQVVRFLKDEEGLTTVEYAVAGGLISLAVITAFTNLGNQVNRVISEIGNTLASVK